MSGESGTDRLGPRKEKGWSGDILILPEVIRSCRSIGPEMTSTGIRGVFYGALPEIYSPAIPTST